MEFWNPAHASAETVEMEAARAMMAMVNCMLMVGGMRCRIATKGLLIKCGIMWQVASAV